MKLKITLLLAFSCLFIHGQNTSLNFDGTDDRVQIPHSSELMQDSFTFEAWIKLNQLGSYYPIFTKYNTSVGQLSYVFSVLNDGRLEIGVYESMNTFISFDSNTAIQANIWHHIATSFDLATNTIKCYIDGVEVSGNTNGTIGSIMLTNIPVSIGSITDINGTVDYLDGFVDEFRFWNIIKTESEIQASMNTELTGLEAGLISYYKMDDDSIGCDVYDCNSNENHGARTGVNGTNNLPQYATDAPMITDVNCGASLSSCTLSVITREANEIKIYPNPATDILNIELQESNSTNTIEIYSMNGVKMYESEIKNKNKISLKLEFASGIYIVKLTGNKDVMKYFKIAKR